MAASALAAVTAALVSSTFGVAGTLIGTAIASVCASVGSTLYWASLHRTNEHLRRVAVAARRTDWGSSLATRPTRRLPVSGGPGVASPPTFDEPPTVPMALVLERPQEPPAATPTGWDRLRWSNLRSGLPVLRRRWIAVVGLTALVFVVALAVLTAIQASSNQRLTALPASTSHSKPAPTPSVTPAPSPTPSATTLPSPTPSPTGSASPTPSAPPSSAVGSTPTPSSAPSGGASPAPSASAATLP